MIINSVKFVAFNVPKSIAGLVDEIILKEKEPKFCTGRKRKPFFEKISGSSITNNKGYSGQEYDASINWKWKKTEMYSMRIKDEKRRLPSNADNNLTDLVVRFETGRDIDNRTLRTFLRLRNLWDVLEKNHAVLRDGNYHTYFGKKAKERGCDIEVKGEIGKRKVRDKKENGAFYDHMTRWHLRKAYDMLDDDKVKFILENKLMSVLRVYMN